MNKNDGFLFEDGMIIANSPSDELRKGIVLSHNGSNSFAIFWENGTYVRWLNNHTRWIIFEYVGMLSPKELLAAKLKYSDKLSKNE